MARSDGVSVPDNSVDPLTRIAALAYLRTSLDDLYWEAIHQARREGISLRRISTASGISTTHLARKLEVAA